MKTIFYSLFAAAALWMFAQSSTAEARHHCGRHCRSGFGFSVGNTIPYTDTYVVRQYAAPVVVAPVAPVYSPYYGPVVAAPVYPAYVQDVYVPVRRPAFGGLSFSWNFFR